MDIPQVTKEGGPLTGLVGALVLVVFFFIWRHVNRAAPPGIDARTHIGSIPIDDVLDHQARFLRNLPTTSFTDDSERARAALESAILLAAKSPTDSSRKQVPQVPLPEKLAEALWAQLIARAQESSNAYLELASREAGYRFLAPADAEWKIIEPKVRFIFKTDDVDRTRAKEDLAGVIDHEQTVSRGSFTAIAHTSEGGGAAFRWIAHASEAHPELLKEVTPDDTWQAWMAGPTHAAVRYRLPRTTLEQVIARDGHALIAETANVIETQAGLRCVFGGVWYFDPVGRQRLVRDLYRRGTAGVWLCF